MTHDRYRSYVIRVRRRLGPSTNNQTRLDVEDLLRGGRATVSGDPAASLAESLERLVESGESGQPAADPRDANGSDRR